MYKYFLKCTWVVDLLVVIFKLEHFILVVSRNMEGMRLSESDGECCIVVIIMMSSPWQHTADELSRQPNVDNISPIDKKAPLSMSRPGML